MEQDTINDLEDVGFTKPKQKRGFVIGLFLTLISLNIIQFNLRGKSTDKCDERLETYINKYENLLIYFIKDQKEKNKQIDTLSTQKNPF